MAKYQVKGAVQIRARSTVELEANAYCDISDAARAAGIKVLRFPIPDFGTPGPDQQAQWNLVRDAVIDDLEAGFHVAIHCLAGIGRSYMVAGGVLVHLGQNPADVVNALRAHQPEAFETPRQVDFLWLSSTTGIAMGSAEQA